MPGTQVRGFVSKFRSNCLETLGLKRKNSKPLIIGTPFDFQHGPPVNFPGFSEDDLSLLREKAIASIAISDDEFDFKFNLQPVYFERRISTRGMNKEYMI